MLQANFINNWELLAESIFVPANKAEYDKLVALLDEVMDVVRDDESHPLASLMEVLGVLIENYEDRYVPELDSDPIAVLKHFMVEYNLRQWDLPELGSQGVVSEILNGKRKLNLRQIQALSQRFKVPLSVFTEDVCPKSETRLEECILTDF
ncbi:MAG: transcriptional regulator [Anaerolineae bacterium]|nr:transcriptional regulator [Anaerolineae bacterium]